MPLFIEMPALARRRNFSQKARSNLVSLESLVCLCLSVVSLVQRSRFMKCLAEGIIWQTCSRQPTKVASSSKFAFGILIISFTEFDQALAFFWGETYVE